MGIFLGSLFIIITNPPTKYLLSPGFSTFLTFFFPVASWLCYLIDCGLAFGFFELVLRRNRLFVRTLFFTNNISYNTQGFLGFRLFDLIFFSCGKVLLSSNRFWTGFSDFQIRSSSKSSFSAELCSKFSIFLKTLKDFWVFDYST